MKILNFFLTALCSARQSAIKRDCTENTSLKANNHILYSRNYSKLTMINTGGLTLSPMGYPPLRYQGRSYLWPHVAKEYLLLGKFSGHIQKFGLKSQKLNEISEFKDFDKFRFCITLMNENLHNLFDF